MIQGLLCGIVLSVFLSFQLVGAQTYVWTDENGNVRFADDLSNVPEMYRKSAVAGPTKRRSEEHKRVVEEGESKRASTQKAIESRQSQQPQRTSDMMEEMVRKFPGLTYEWTQKESLWIRIPASQAAYKEEYSEMASKIAGHYHAKKGHMVCVRFYYGNGKVIAYECR